jgi:hypothetical protein
MDPDGDPVTITITGVTQDEPVDSGDDGNPCPDASGTGGSVVQLRAERQGDGDGRVYHIAFTASDGHGSECTGVVSVCVPKHFGPNRTCVDEGSLFDSTADTCATECSEACGLEIATSSVCDGGKLPRSVNQQFVQARQLLIRAAKQHDQRKVTRLLYAAMSRLHRAARVAAHAARAGQISAACAQSAATALSEARLRVQQSLGNP